MNQHASVRSEKDISLQPVVGESSFTVEALSSHIHVSPTHYKAPVAPVHAIVPDAAMPDSFL